MSHVIITMKDLSAGDVFIPAGSSGCVISEEYLKTSSFSPDDYEELLRKAEQAKANGCYHVYFHDLGKCLGVPQDHVM